MGSKRRRQTYTRTSKSIVTVLAICGYLFGLFYFYIRAAQKLPYNDWHYYWWDKSVGGSVILWLLVLLHSKDKGLILPVFIFACVRFIFDVQSKYTGITVQNTTYLAISFIVFSFWMGIVTLNRFRLLHKHL